MHSRRIHCDGFLREDGLWDIEGSIVDSKAHSYSEEYRGVMEAGSDVHRMIVRLTVGADLVVHMIEVSMPAVPHPSCCNGMANYQGLVGAKIGIGWRRAVLASIGTTSGCTHVRELLFALATVAIQTILSISTIGNRSSGVTQFKPGERPHFIDGCIGWATDGEMVAEMYPEYAAGKS